ncbi:MAG: 2'-5' RNA ligase family protein [Parcubacteria group bacterium]
MEKVIGIHLEVPRQASKIILAGIKRAGITYPRYYRFTPHLTLYHCRFHAAKYATLVRRLNALQLHTVRMRIQKVNVWKNKNGSAFLSLALSRTPDIQKIHRQVLQPANALRGSLIREKERRLLADGAFNRKERQYIERYGSQHVLFLYHPHITLGEVPGTTVKAVVKKLHPSLRRLQKIELVLSTMNVGLYNFDNTSRKYVKVVREKEIALRDE